MTKGNSNFFLWLGLGVTVLGFLVSPGAGAAEHEDTTRPSNIHGLRWTSPVTDKTPSFLWNEATDNVGVHAYWVQVGSKRAKNIGLDAHYEVDPELDDGFHTFSVWAQDAAGNKGAVSSISFSVGDVLKPSPPGYVERTSVDGDFTPTFTWPAATDNVGVDHYEVQLDGTHSDRPYLRWKDIGNVLTYTVPEREKLEEVRAGKLTFSVRAVDAEDNESVPARHEFWPPGSFVAPVLTPNVYAGRLMKLADDNNSNTVHDAAVYYLARDGRRYVFPSEGVYHTWYSNFSSVQIVTDTELQAHSFGGVITHRPGVRLVKLASDKKVYVVSRGGVLRHVNSEQIARNLYGETWNQNIDVISDSVFGNYVVGNQVRRTGHFDVTAERDAVQTIDYDKNFIE